MSTNQTTIVLMFVFICIFYLAVLAVAVINYLLTSLALQKIAKRRQINYPWLAWLPIGNYWIIGSIADNYDARNGMQRKWRLALLILPLIGMVTYIVMYFAMFTSLISTMTPYVHQRTLTPEALMNFVVLTVFFVILFIIPIAMITATQILTAICQYKIYESTVPEKALKYIIISLLVPLGSAICLFICRNSGYEVQPPYPQMPQPPMENMYQNTLPQQSVNNTYPNYYNQQPINNNNQNNY